MSEIPGLLVLLTAGAAAVVTLLVVILVREARNPPRQTAAWAVARNRPCDPGDLGLEYESWTLDRPDGARLPVWEIRCQRPPPEEGAPDTFSVVFLHGWGRSRVAMLARMAPWGEIADRLVLYDLRGHGDAEGGPSRLGHGEADDLLALLERLGPGRFVLVGFSMGAVIAIDAASRPGPLQLRIAGVVAYGAYADFHRSLQGRLRSTGFPARPFTDIAMWWLRLRGLRHRLTSDAAGDLKCPLLLVHGSDDAISPVEHAEHLARRADDATLLRVEGAAHGDVAERDPIAHDAAVRRFLDEVTRTVQP